MADLIAIEKAISGPRMTGRSSKLASHGLESLLGDVAQAIDRQDIKTALRLADRAQRLASKDPACILLYARLLIKAGFANQALDYSDGKDDPDILLVRGTALLELGLLAEASQCCRDILQRFSVNAVDGLSVLASRLCRTQGSNFPGWVGVDDHLNLIGEARGTSRVYIECSDGSHSPIRFADGRDELIPFVCSLPTNASGPLRIRADDSELLAADILWPPEFKPTAWVAMEGEALVGEAQLGWSPKRRLCLELSNSDGSALRTIATKSDTNSVCSFSISLLPSELAASRLDIALVLPDGKRIRAVGSPLVCGRRSPAKVDDWPLSAVVRHSVIEPVAISENARIIDIIVPVYAGRQETLDCLRSVLRTTDRERTEVVVVNDASPDARLCEALASLAAENQITLISNSRNLGFAGAVNRGIKLHPGRDVILLNSDTKVFGNWIERLSHTACTSADIGTVTPLGERGSITDYSPGESSTEDSAEEIDRIASDVNSGRVIDIPVAVGFCMYIKRKCLDQTGELDAITFGRGYGEENDFCLRARTLGWRHVAAADMFVAHQGGRSFGESAKALRKRNSRVLNALHPGYDTLIEDFSAEDPLLEARRAIDMRRLVALASDPVLLVTHDLLGGVMRHIGHRENELSAAGHTVIVLQRSDSRESSTKVSLTVSSLGLGSLKFDSLKDLPLLEQLLRDLRLFHVELHHFLRLPPAILHLVTQITVPYDVYIHDYSWICPRITLIGGTGRYCGEPTLAGCEQCIQTNGSAMEEAITVVELRDRSARLLKAARRVVAPSVDSRERLAKYFPEQKFETTPWESVSIPRLKPTSEAAGRVRVAIIGAIGIAKGYQVLLDCARDATARDLNLEFVVIGYTVDDRALLDTGRVFVTGPYREEEVGMLFDREGCHVAFFPSVAPETWCYSLTHAITRGLPIIAFDLGAQAERLRTYPAAELLPLSLNPQQVNFALIHWRRMAATRSEQQDGEADQVMSNGQSDTPERGSQELVSSVQVLNLPEGIYTFTVNNGSHLRDGSETLALPALQVGIAPARSSGVVEFLTGSSTVERWLAYRTDKVVVRILGGDASLMLTSLQKQDSPSLEVDVERLNAHPSSIAAEANKIETFAETVFDGLLVRLMAHIRYIGDLDFDTGCAGWTGQKLWIEGFAVVNIGHLPPSAIEYRGIAANGLQTPWLSNQSLCGSRGDGLPLLGYAIRFRANWSERYQCAYFGRFLSGARVGPLENGALCASDLPGDPLEAIELRIMERQLQTTSVADVEHRERFISQLGVRSW